MNQKTTIGLVIALLLGVGGVWWLNRSDEGETPKPKSNEPKALFEKIPDDVVGFETVKGDQAFVFKRVDTTWRMKAPVKGPAQSGTVAADADKVKNLKFTKSYPKNDADRPSEKVSLLDNPVRVMKLTAKDGKALVLKIGGLKPLTNSTFVQKEGDDTIYLVDGDLAKDFNRRMTDYRGTKVLDAAVPEVVKIEAAGTATFTAVKTDNTWTLDAPVKGRADQAKVSGLASTLAGLTATNFVEDAPKTLRPYGLDAPTMTVAVTIEKKTPKPPPASMPTMPEFDIQTRVVKLLIGGTADEKTFAKVDDPEMPAVFQIAKATVTQLAPALNDLRDKRVTAAAASKAQKIALKVGGQQADLTATAGNWQITPAGGAPQPAETLAVTDLLAAITNLNAVGFEDADTGSFGLADPRAVLTLTVEGKPTPTQLTVGGLTPSKTGVYIRNDEENVIAVVPVDAAEKLLVPPPAFLSRALVEFARDRVTRIDLTRAGQTRTVQNLAGAWTFAAPVVGAADTAAVNNILADLASLRGRKVVALAADAAKFGLTGGDALKVDVTVNPPPKPQTVPTSAAASQPVEPPAPPVTHTLVVSKTADGKVVAMNALGQTICEIDAKILADLDAELLDTRVLSVLPSLASGLSISGATALAFEKSGEAWKLVGESTFQVDVNKIMDTLNALRDLKARRYAKYSGANPAEFGLDKPAVTVKVQLEAGPVELLLSDRGPSDTERYATASANRDRVFVISKDDAAKFTKTAKDYQSGGTPPAGMAPPMGGPMGGSPMQMPPRPPAGGDDDHAGHSHP